MRSTNAENIRVGDVFIAATFQVTPAELMGHRLGEVPVVHGDVVVSGHGNLGWGVPVGLVVTRAVDALVHSSLRRGGSLQVRAVGAPSVLSASVVGEPLTTVATVRYRSRQRRGRVHLTLAAAVHRRDGRALCCFEVGVEVVSPTGIAPRLRPVLRRVA